MIVFIIIIFPPFISIHTKAGSSEGVFVGLDQILFDPDIPHLQQLSNLTLLSELRHICDVKTHGDTTLYRLNDDKLIEWLSGEQTQTTTTTNATQMNKKEKQKSIKDACKH